MNTEYFKSFKKLSPDFFSIEIYKKSLEIGHLILYYRLACVAECATHSLRPLHKTKIGGVSYG